MTKAFQITKPRGSLSSGSREQAVAKELGRFSKQYVTSLKHFIAKQDEAGLEEAFRLGRHALSIGMGVLDMTRIYSRTLASATGVRSERQRKAAEIFFLEALSPFEVTHRGFRETNARLAQLIPTLEKRNQDLATLSNQIVQLQEEDRKRLSRELHDNIGQTLTAVSFSLAALKATAAGNPQDFQEKLNDAQQLLNNTNDAIQNFARELRPSLLDQLGLLPALRSMANGFIERTRIEIQVTGVAAAERLTNTQKTVLFRIAQERLGRVTCISNITRVKIAICKTRRGICMTIADDAELPRRNGKYISDANERVAFLGMQERVHLINGVLKALANGKRGTTLRVSIPYLHVDPKK